jgi:hypothetical protein
MVDIEVRKSGTPIEKTESANLDVNEIIGKVRTFIDNIKEMRTSGEPMETSVEGFNFSVAKEDGGYDLTLKLKLELKPKS